jgi:hypothetical protein
MCLAGRSSESTRLTPSVTWLSCWRCLRRQARRRCGGYVWLRSTRAGVPVVAGQTRVLPERDIDRAFML